MRNETTKPCNAVCSRQAELKSVEDGTQQFKVSPTVERTLQDMMGAFGGFLSPINICALAQQQSERLRLDGGTDAMQLPIDDYLRRSREAIRELLNIPRVTVELL